MVIYIFCCVSLEWTSYYSQWLWVFQLSFPIVNPIQMWRGWNCWLCACFFPTMLNNLMNLEVCSMPTSLIISPLFLRNHIFGVSLAWQTALNNTIDTSLGHLCYGEEGTNQSCIEFKMLCRFDAQSSKIYFNSVIFSFHSQMFLTKMYPESLYVLASS